MDQIVSFITGAILFGFLMYVYFYPTTIARRRQKRNADAILVLNLFLGWTFVGWVIALVWSLAIDDKS